MTFFSLDLSNFLSQQAGPVVLSTFLSSLTPFSACNHIFPLSRNPCCVKSNLSWVFYLLIMTYIYDFVHVPGGVMVLSFFFYPLRKYSLVLLYSSRGCSLSSAKLKNKFILTHRLTYTRTDLKFVYAYLLLRYTSIGSLDYLTSFIVYFLRSRIS